METADSRTVIGYATYGDTMRSAVQPIVDQFAIQLFDDGTSLRDPTQSSLEAADSELGCGADSPQKVKIERSQTDARSLPTLLTLSYYDPARDYQMAQTRASIPSKLANLQTKQLAAVIDSGSARALAETTLARLWAERDTLRLRLPPNYLALEPGMLLQPPSEATFWIVSKVEIDSMTAVVDLHSRYSAIGSVAADPGRVLSAVDVVAQPTSLALIELPDLTGTSGDSPFVAIAASNGLESWSAIPLQIETAGGVQTSQTAPLATVLGIAQTALAGGQSQLLDLAASVDVQLINAEQWLESCDDDALVNGDNLAVIGDELVQFGDVVPLGLGKFRLSRLLRGRRGTEWAMGAHLAGETFALVDPLRLQRISCDASAIGSNVTVTPLGIADSSAGAVSRTITGEALEPPSPVHLRAVVNADGSVDCSWCRRSRLGWAWIDGVDAPLGCSSEQYQVQLQGPSSSMAVNATTPSLNVSAADVAALGTGTLTLTVKQVGDLAVSHPDSVQFYS